MQSHNIQFADKTTNEINIFQASVDTHTVIILFPALGVRASYYKGFAEALSKSGVHVCTTDWRGQGKSSVRASRKVNYGYKELLEDMGEVIDFVETQFPQVKNILWDTVLEAN